MTVEPVPPPGTGPTKESSTTGGHALVLRGLVKRFGENAAAVNGIDLDVNQGEFLTLLGPSGSGKTTTLRMIAGFTLQDEGTITIGGDDMSRVPPYRRDVGMVFQNYALFPHMTAAQNVGFPLEMRGIGREERRRQVAEALALVKLGSYGDRYPRELSGGQQQRIALARAVVFGPRLLLMDEPLGALDKKLREALQLEIVRIARQIGATVIYVTHDQEEALVMSDRIAILNEGRIEQLGAGEDLYQRPASLFVADFIGESNILRGRLERNGDGGWLTRSGWHWRVNAASDEVELREGPAALIVRPERLRVESRGQATDPSRNTVEATVTEVLYVGATRKIALRLPDGQVAIGRESAAADAQWSPGDEVNLSWAVRDGVVVPDPGS
jgi:putative spermidine/putrescine transport system ATP-binding protein